MSSASCFSWAALVFFCCCCCSASRVRSARIGLGLLNGQTKLTLPGDIILGGLFPIHEKGQTSDVSQCGQIGENRGIQRLEAMVYALNKINADKSILPDIRLGAKLLDTCSRDTFALEQSMDFVTDHLSTLDSAFDYRCADSPAGTAAAARRKGRQAVAGVIGAADSSVSIMIANILRLFKIPQISYASTSPELSDNNRFDYFFRVVPPDNYQAKAMVAIVRSMGWNYVTAIYDEGTYGERGFQEFKSHASQQGICINKYLVIPRNARNDSLAGIADGLLKLEKSRVVVAFCQAETLRLLFGQLGSRLTKRSFFWVASDGWGRKTEHLLGEQFLAEGAISLLPERRAVAGFDQYFRNLTRDHAQVNPWWPEFWESHFHCSWDGRPGSGLNNCTGAEQIGLHSRYEQEGLVPMVVDAVYAMAHSLENMLHRLCPSVHSKSCRDIIQKLNGTVLRDHIRNVSFIGTSGNILRFNRKGDRESLYEIFQFQRRPAGKNASSVFEYVKIGTWGDDHLELDNSSLRWGTPDEVVPRSVCSEPCGFGYRTVAPNKEAATCCWECVPCDNKYQIVLNATLCSNCELGSVPNRFFNECQPLPVETIQLGSVWALLPMTFSFLGLVWTVFVLVVFVRYNNTPIIRASGRELCYVMLAGVSMSYCMTFIMLAPPTPVTCGFLRIFNGLSLSIIYSAIFTKTNRLSRIFNRGIKSLMKKPSYTSPKSQLILCCCLVSVQVIGDMTWLGMDLPKTKFDYPDRDHKVLRCAVDDVAIVVSLLYNMILIVLCTLYAFKTRNIPENFNEAKYIAFTMYSTCIVWLAFIAIYFGSLRNFRIKLTSLCMCISISASVTVGCMFVPKIYIVLFKPHKNVRRSNASPAAGGGGASAQGRRELFSPTKKPLLLGSGVRSRSEAAANIDTAEGRAEPPTASALPADGGVASDSDSDSGGDGGGGNIKGPDFAGIAFLIAGRPKSEQQQQQQQQVVTYSPLTCQVSTQILGEDSDNYRDDNFALPDEIFANPCVRETAL